MASAASPSRKRKSSSSDVDNGPSSRKKRKDSERDASKDSRQSRRSKPKSKKDIKAGLKTVSELAKLVTSGAVQVPKSLVHYASDKPLLLDQIFTILSPNDVTGMLPDILKGLKIKRIKSLCHEQLKQMSVEEITRALQREETTPVDVSTTAEMTSSESNRVPPAATVNKQKDSIEKAGEETVGKTAQVLPGENRKKDRNTPNPDSSPEGKEVLNSPRDTSSQSKDEISLHVSDISDGEEKGKVYSREAEKPSEGEGKARRKYGDASKNNEPAVLKEEYIITSLRIATHKRQNSDIGTKTLVESQDIKMEKMITDTYTGTTSSDDVMRDDDDDKDDVMSDMDTHEGLAVDEKAGSESSDEGSDDLDVEVSELDAAKLLEMEMRRRALESELKKFSQTSEQTTKLRSETSLADDRSASSDNGECSFLALHVSESETLDSAQCESSKDSGKRKSVSLEERGSRDSAGVGEVKMETDTLDIGQLLEMKLRQKALQSLLNKKKQKSSTQ